MKMFLVLFAFISLSAMATERPYTADTFALFQSADNSKEFVVRSDFNFADGNTYATGSYIRGEKIASGSLITDVKV